MSESVKSHYRRMKNGDYDKFFSGEGIDIGSGRLPVRHLHCRAWDKADGDATYMYGVKDETYDWVFSSHCLEHLEDWPAALRNWWRILKPGGYLIITVPDFYLYEHGYTKPQFNKEHLSAWTLQNLTRTLAELFPLGQILRVQINEDNFNYADHESDQTAAGAQAEIEAIVRKQKDHFWVTGRT